MISTLQAQLAEVAKAAGYNTDILLNDHCNALAESVKTLRDNFERTFQQLTERTIQWNESEAVLRQQLAEAREHPVIATTCQHGDIREQYLSEYRDNLKLIAQLAQVREALEALGSKPDGYCFCVERSQVEAGHTGECLQAQKALSQKE